MSTTTRIACAAVLAGAGLAAGCATPDAGPAGARGVPVEDPAFADLAWLAGGWAATTDRGVTTEEYWTAPAGGTMFGINRVTSEGRTAFFEYLRIEHEDDGGLVYLASPAGRQPPTPFRLVESGSGRAVFANPDHDFPQRIGYERQADGTLRNWIEGEQDGTPRVSAWRLARIP